MHKSYVRKTPPYVNVQGKAGGSYDASVGDEGYQAYVFKTDKGNFMITISEGSGTNPYYSTNHLLSKDVKLNECLDTESGRGKPSCLGNNAEETSSLYINQQLVSRY